MNEILKYDSTNSYSTMSIASIGPSTLPDAKIKPKITFIPKSTLVDNFCSPTSSTTPSKHDLNDISDINGAQPFRYRERNYVSKALCLDDIEGAKGKVRDKFLWTNRHVDPLNPTYKLPSCEIAPSEPPKFLRDGLEIDDIQGTRSKKRTIIPNRDPLHVDDIEGARSGWKPPHMRARAEAPPHEVNMTVSKPKSDRFTDHTQRNTDPLQPSYYIHGSSYSEIDRNHPSKLRNEITDSKLLRTDDIEGAQAGYVTKHRLSIPEDKRREYRNINYLDDIDGAHADTIKHSIRTTRSINPLVPLYQSLDGDILSGPIDSLVPHHLIDQKSDFKSYGTVRGNSVKTQQPSRHNLFSRSGNSVMSPSSSIQHFPPHSPSKDGDYYSYQHNENTGGIALADFTLAQSKSYAEKYFPQVLSPNNSSQTTDLHSPVKLQLGSLTRSQPNLMSPVDTIKHNSSGFSSPITTNRSKTSLSSRRQKVEYDAEVDAVRRL